MTMTEVPERVVIRYGKFEVLEERLKPLVEEHRMVHVINDKERFRIIEARSLYLEWMHQHFAKKVYRIER